MFRANHVPARARRKLLGLIGLAPRPPEPARTVLAFSLAPGAAPTALPAGLVLAGGEAAAREAPFRLEAPVAVGRAELAAVQVDDGSGAADRTGELAAAG